jgi:hypothetical protein
MNYRQTSGGICVQDLEVISPAEAFFDFAFPAYGKCPGQLLSEKDRLFEMYKNEKSPTMHELEKLFPVGFFEMRMYAGDPCLPVDKITLNHVREYVFEGHNLAIVSGRMKYHPTHEPNYCKVLEGIVVDRDEDIMIAKLEGKDRRVWDYKTRDLSPGDRVFVHRSYTLSDFR